MWACMRLRFYMQKNKPGMIPVYCVGLDYKNFHSSSPSNFPFFWHSSQTGIIPFSIDSYSISFPHKQIVNMFVFTSNNVMQPQLTTLNRECVRSAVLLYFWNYLPFAFMTLSFISCPILSTLGKINSCRFSALFTNHYNFHIPHPFAMTQFPSLTPKMFNSCRNQ
jgi:hypothetical protein